MITNPQIIKFSNENVRTFCDKIASAYLGAKQLLTLYEAKSVESMVSGVWFDTLDDGSDVDGRTPISGSGIIAVQRIARWIVLNAEADDNYTVNTVFNVAVNL